MFHLGEAIGTLQNLKFTSINLSKNDITDKGTQLLLGGIEKLKNLTKIDLFLSETKLSDKSA